MKIKAILAVTVLAIASLSLAQGGQGGRGGQGGQGRMGMQGRGGNSMTGLLNRKDVQSELKLSNEQLEKIEAARPQRGQGGAGAGGGQRGQGGQGGQGFDREAMAKAQAEQEKKFLDILNGDQQKRLKELYIQRVGNQALVRADIQKDLEFTDAQKAKISDLQTKQREAMQTVMEKMRNGEIQREELADLMTKNTKILDEELGKVLTADQAAKFKAMGGTKFEFDKDN